MLGNIFEGKNILVTGGAGSIGSRIVQELLNYNPNAVRVLDNNETAQFNLQDELKDFENVRFLIGDVRFKDRIKRAMEDIDIVFHAAALKHVPFCEYNPFEAIQTNVVGTQNTIDAAIDEEIEKFIAISTDKAVKPINTMGATKLLSEKLVTSANYYKGNRKTIFSSVRFGNVIGSSGSVIPLFKKQIQEGRSITLTEPKMTRFVMSIKQSVSLVFKSTKIARGGELFIFKMPTLELSDLVEVMIKELGPKYGYEPQNIKIKLIGKRPGEKLHEDLMTEEEAKLALETEDMFIVLPPFGHSNLDGKNNTYPNAKPTKLTKYTSKDGRLITKEEIKRLLYEEKLI